MDDDARYLAVRSRDRRFDGVFFTGVRTTGIYCRPSCPAVTPRRRNVGFYRTAAAAQRAGYRACKRCRPDATPGSPEWDVRADAVGRAMRLIADGVVDRDGVPGLADRLGYSERHIHRLLIEEVGAGPLAVARAQRAQTARVLLETTALPVTDVAFAAGFASVRQFNDTIREVFAVTPTDLRRRGAAATDAGSPDGGAVTVRLPYREPYDVAGVLGFLAARAVPGVEEVAGSTYRRTLRLPRRTGIVELTFECGFVRCALWLDDLRDLAAAVRRCRRLLDLDADPVAIGADLGRDPLLAPYVAANPGVRSPGAVDGDEVAVRAVLGQQVSVAGAQALAGRLVARFGEPLPRPCGALTYLFPAADVLAGAADGDLPLPEARCAALRTLATALAGGQVELHPGADREDVARRLTALPGIGPWTAGYVVLRALGDPDTFLAGDLGVRRALRGAGEDGDVRAVAGRADAWRPWRSYAMHHLWWGQDQRSLRAG